MQVGLRLLEADHCSHAWCVRSSAPGRNHKRQAADVVQVGVRHKHRPVVHCALCAVTLRAAVPCRAAGQGTGGAKERRHTCGQRPVSNTSLCRGRMTQVSWPATLMPSTSTPARVKGACLPAHSQWILVKPHATRPSACVNGWLLGKHSCKSARALQLLCHLQRDCMSAIRKQTRQ